MQTLGGGDWVNFYASGHITTGEWGPGIHWIGESENRRAGEDAMDKRFIPCQKYNFDLSIVCSVAWSLFQLSYLRFTRNFEKNNTNRPKPSVSISN